MRFSIVLLTALVASACGKTGALYLPEQAPEPVPQNTQQQQPETTSDEKAD